VTEQKELSDVSQKRVKGDWTMTLKSFLAAFAVLLSATTVSFAQSQPNCGANAPGIGDTFGKPNSGTLSGAAGAERCRARTYRRHAHRHYRRHLVKD
jgi:hypothetical protein